MAKDIQFWNQPDCQTKNGRPSSFLPAYCKPGTQEKEEEDTREAASQNERNYAMGVIERETYMREKNRLAQKEERLEVNRSKPVLTGSQRDDGWELHQHLEKEWVASNGIYDDMMRGRESAKDELKRQTVPHIQLNEKQARMLQSNYFDVDPQGKITSKTAARAYKILGSILGENTSLEDKRRRANDRTIKMARTLEELSKD
jgi:hypothetical protein